ncbi:MAG: twin-arginine translocase TatA/TatE family subunit [Polaribacter sp.]|jgi:sec-independent protein translocase protein TatA|nr:twin-arginine translocase TatA/TatE family subunit [Polaribacter sp.]MBT4779295.1 twin-arginine translocase TatA/TatE family subunit [Polaribacter sp.]MBT5646024.1 twin-arginine translocase TatA/TatE family subunit [Polaribacter sp.]MBT7705126.1 twin-arginine translocase TatA/TatE family subunit [Polaribacter sp.]MDG1110578.1 twin-arginine translocase TatA/TatE family subunit [Polaribacter sp.]MDG1222491.1 twin-arginine translocase TatA/TatE family subunit [Polaribacter sp.]
MISLNIFLLGMPSPLSMALIVGALLLLFGGKKIPELMKGIGGGIKEFKKATKDEEKEAKKDEKLEEGN